MTTLSVVFPCYNEEESVHPVMKEAVELLKQGHKLEVIVVDDGSKDASFEELQKYSDSIRCIRHDHNQGYGAALKTGLFYSQGDYFSFLDFDGTCQIQQAIQMWHLAEKQNLDMVMGFRLHSESQMPTTRRIGNHLYRGLLKSLYPSCNPLPQDVCTGFRVLKRSAAEDLFLNLPNDLSFSPALTAKALRRGYMLKDHPIVYRERFGHSKISLLKDGFKFGRALVTERFL